MSCGMYALLLPNNAFRLPLNPGPATNYTRADPNNLTPLTHTEQATVITVFARQKHYFQSMQNIECACFTALKASINNASRSAIIWPWLNGMRVWQPARFLINCPKSMASLLRRPWNSMMLHFAASIQLPMPPESSSIASKTAPRLQFWVITHTRIAS